MGSTRKNSKQIVVKTNENHDWLPDGWVKESKIRKSGIRAGTEYKCYVDPSSGSKFYSKPEVLRYLKTMSHSANSSDQQKQGTGIESVSKSDTSQSPVSEPVPEHSNSAEESDQEYRHKTSGSISTIEKNVVVETEKVEDLPDGWIKETRIRKTSHGIRKDPYYKDPLSGRTFRSKKGVFRFIGDKFKLSSEAEPQKLKQSSTRRELFGASEEESNLAEVDISAANMPKEGQDIELTSKTKVGCLTKNEVASGMQWPKSATTEPSDNKENFDRATLALSKDENFAKELDKRVSSEAGTVTPGAVELANIDVLNGKVQETYKNTSNKKNVGGRSRHSRRLSGVQLELGTKTVANEHALQVVNGKSSHNRTILSNNLTTEESQKLVSGQGIHHRYDASISVSAELDGGITTQGPNDILVSEIKMQKLETERINLKKPEGKHCVSTGLDFPIKQVSGNLSLEDSPHTGSALAVEEDLQEDKLPSRRSERVYYGKSRIYSKKGNSLPRRASKRLAGVEPELIGNSISCEKALEYTSKRSKKEVTVVTSATLVPQQLRGPEAEKLCDEKGESNFSFSFHYSWSDPCLEFAIKTLTGALPVEDAVDVDPILNMEKNNMRCGMDENSIKNCEVKTKKSKKKLNLSSQSSKRPAGHESELGAKPISSKRASEYNPRKSYKESQETSQQPEVGTKIDLTRVNDRMENIQLSNSCDMSCKAQVSPKERQKNEQVEEINGEEKSGPQTSFPFCESWSDPCIDFAIKTLTGALSEDTAHLLPISNPEAKIMPNRKISQTVKLPGSEPEWMACSTSSKCNKKRAIEQSFEEDVKVERMAIDGAFQHLETRGETELGKFGSTTATTSMHEAFSEKIQNDFGSRTVPEVPNSGSFLESWSDPCLDFAIKTLTGAISVEEILEIPGYLQQVHTSTAQAHAGSVLPDLGLPFFFLNDISSHFDVPDKSGGLQQSVLNLPLAAPGAANLANCASTDSSRRYSQSQGVKNMHEGKLLP